jgi:hypothetical protein
MAEALRLPTDTRPPKSRMVHHMGYDVEGVYPFPEDLAGRAVRATGAGDGTFIHHEILRGGLAPVIQRVARVVSLNFDEIRDELPCNKCDKRCGLLDINGLASGSSRGLLNLSILAGVDRARPEERERPDRPLIRAHIRCFNALVPQADDNYELYAKAQVEGLPDGMQFDERCHLMMGEVATAAFSQFENRITTLEAAHR